MGMSTDGQLCFGYAFEDGWEAPWYTEDDEGDIETWWREVNGFKPSDYPYTEEGEVPEGVDPNSKEYNDRIEKYWEEKREWDEANPIPVELVRHCSYEYPMFILAAKDTLSSNSRGNLVVNIKDLSVSEKQYADLIEFVNKYKIEVDGEPCWLLSSMMG